MGRKVNLTFGIMIHHMTGRQYPHQQQSLGSVAIEGADMPLML